MEEQEGNNVQETMQTGNKGKNAVNKGKDVAKKGKKLLEQAKNIKALAPLVSALGTVAIVLLIIFLIIGFIGFFTTLPGLGMEKFTENASTFLKWLLGSEKIDVSDEQITDLANYIQELGYGLEEYGFTKVGTVKREDQDNKDKITSVEWDEKNNLYAYILQNERTYTLQLKGTSLEGTVRRSPKNWSGIFITTSSIYRNCVNYCRSSY